MFLAKLKPSNLQVEAITPDPEAIPAPVEAPVPQPTRQPSHSTNSGLPKFHNFRQSELSWISSKYEQSLRSMLMRRAGSSPLKRVVKNPPVSKPTEQQDVLISTEVLPLLASHKPSVSEDVVMVDASEGVESEICESSVSEEAEMAMEVDTIPPEPDLDSIVKSILSPLAVTSSQDPTGSDKAIQPPAESPTIITSPPHNHTITSFKPITPTTPTIPEQSITPLTTPNQSNSPPAPTPPTPIHAHPITPILVNPNISPSCGPTPGPSTISPPHPAAARPSLPSPVTPTLALQTTADICNAACAAGLFTPRKRPLQDSHQSNNSTDGPSSPKRSKLCLSSSPSTSRSFARGVHATSSSGENSLNGGGCGGEGLGFNEKLVHR